MKLEDQNYNKSILNEQQCNDLIREYLSLDKPFFAGRSGITECNIISYAIKQKKTIPEQIKKNAFTGAGIYPNNNENLINFAHYYADCMKNLDIVAVMPGIDYDWLVNTYCPNAHYVRLWGLEPFHFPNPWSELLKDKNVLVIHPFERSIINNYKNKEKLFDNPKVLPSFNLKTIKAEQNMGDNSANFFESIKRMQDKIVGVDFDIAIMGCGAYGLPLASFIRTLKKTAIHMAGATQILFGIIGKRWEAYPQFKNIINEHWTRPLSEEIPKDYLKVENGCYW
jgi:hypothetical protein